MSGEAARSILRRVRVFAGLGDAECDALLRVVKARRGAPGDALFTEGDRGASLVVVLEGELVATVRGEEIARLGPGEVVGEMAFVDAEPRSATVTATAPAGATVIELGRDALAALAREPSGLGVLAAIQRNVLTDLARRLREAGDRIAGPTSIGARASAGAGEPRAARAATIAELAGLPALAGYAREDLELLAYVAQLRTFAPGAALVREGAPGDACFLIAAGEVAVTRAGHARPLATLGPGAIVGQLALLDRAPRSATVTATRDTAALEIPASAFANLVRASSPLALRFQWQIAVAGVRQLREATKALAEEAARASQVPGATRFLEDWDEGSSAPIELAIDPAHARR